MDEISGAGSLRWTLAPVGRRRWNWLGLLLAALVVSGCGSDDKGRGGAGGQRDGGGDSGSPALDSGPGGGPADGGHGADLGVEDSGVRDAGQRDAGHRDQGITDSGWADTGAGDSGPGQDLGARDSGLQDTGPEDSGLADTGPRDSGPRDSGPQDSGPADTGPPPAPVRVRLMAANITSGNAQSYQGPGIRIFQAIGPDVAMVQEFNYEDDTDQDIRTFVDTAFGEEFSYFREPRGSIPNGVVSRWTIVEAGSWDDPEVNNRGFAWARIDIPGPRDLVAVSVHLLTRNAGTRNREAEALVRFVRSEKQEEDYLVIAGDFNTNSRGESCIGTLADVVFTRGPYPADQRGNDATNAKRQKPYDWVLVDRYLGRLATPVELDGLVFRDGLVFDSRVYADLGQPLPEPVLPDDSGARNMQHMAVVRDFLVPQ